MAKRIVIMAGGTGGHVFPALAVAQELSERDWRVSWLGTRKGIESRVVPEHGIDIEWLSVEGVRGKGAFGKLTGILKLFKACAEALLILRRCKPDVVLGMGGFVAAPGGLMSKALGIPLLIHEQNRVPGTTNRLLAARAKIVMEAFPGSFADDVKAVCTGNPLRKAFRDMTAKQPWSSASGRPLRILVVGGSQGAQVLNEVAPRALAKLGDVEIKHQAGRAMAEQVSQQYQALGIKAQTLSFIDDIAAAYQWADLVICRAGAMTVSEIAAAGLPAVLIPLPHAIDDHQTANARYLTEAGAGILLPQHELSEETLKNAVEKMISGLAAMSRAARSMARLDATKAVADRCAAEVRS
ncbi:undecaprenyldiphospho-muramoylpentapeptide beta-N-acetylglucosaminyltransferase [Methylomarinum sp. Ch1-1]|uniref:UDP-N-acetylglucosamine--N-acetylmuramyl-(pentapeptide) pyrophosphoryl-undecaprenol N-acetylglucosamine transferase n=1 Tax=Methylomarinum roseum TaxID=3067653 RepID=A0AAU7NXL6_9GAMM|nr:undecaprenyldiphospho-muramoylpentapeptide beta-N-acetylglucosaminyltransferase [Methylomarinum sp. Ch1-1]MDP4522168.1 undecaprenyldiphospho-muramoylpentapeptide beta-N-acetylglucosaminyltransferase [Methylomarinum sp. Ch1-1]